MSGVDKDQKTEEATPKRLKQLREKGKVAKSTDVVGLLAFFAALALLFARGSALGRDVSMFAVRAFRLVDVAHPMQALHLAGRLFVLHVGPIAAVAALAAIGATLAQTRLFFSFGQLQPKPERFDVLGGLRRLLPGPHMLTETAKSFLKVAFVALIVYWQMSVNLVRFAVLPAAETEAAATAVGDIVFSMLAAGSVGLLILAALDYVIVWRRHRNESKMAPHEVKQENKETEGDPQLKAKRKQRALELSRSRSLHEVQNATVLVANPTHITIALRYDAEKEGVPILTAKGVDEVALHMRRLGRQHRIPIVEDRPLARALHATGKLNRPIPVELYASAARVIAHVLGLSAERRA